MQRRVTFSTAQVAEKVGCDSTTVVKYAKKLNEVGAIKTASKRKGKFDANQYECLDLKTPFMPLEVREGYRDQLWRSMRIQKVFTVKTLQVPTTATRDLVAHFIGALTKFGIVVKEVEHNSGKRDSYCIYRLVKDLGPQKPIVGEGWVFDPNSCKYLEAISI
jgi:predicted transcriptional regulator